MYVKYGYIIITNPVIQRGMKRLYKKLPPLPTIYELPSKKAVETVPLDDFVQKRELAWRQIDRPKPKLIECQID